jgi:adenylylsulfate kinase
MTGLSGSGKSTIAQYLEAKLYENGFLTQVLDGDNLRSGLNKNLNFSPADRDENIRRVAEVAKLFLNCGVITICTFISPTIASREQAKEIIGAEDFLEIFINTPIEVCEARDVKGLYKKARAGEIKDFTGIDAPYEIPIHPDLSVVTDGKTIDETVEVIYQYILSITKSV